MSPFTIYVGCGHCGGDLEVVTQTPYEYGGLNKETATVLQCKRSGHHLWVMRSELLRAPVDAAATERQRKHRDRQRKTVAA